MAPLPPPAIIALVVVPLVLALVIVKAVKASKARKEFDAWVARHGFQRLPPDTQDRPNRYRGHDPFGRGFDRRAHNIIQGSWETRPFEAFNYQYKTESRDSKGRRHVHVHDHRVVVWNMPIASPGLTIANEQWGHKLIDALGAEDIDFESDEFSRAYWVKSSDRKFAYDALHPRAMQALLEHRTPFKWEWKGTLLLLVGNGNHTAPALESALKGMTSFTTLLPRYMGGPAMASPAVMPATRPTATGARAGIPPAAPAGRGHANWTPRPPEGRR